MSEDERPEDEEGRDELAALVVLAYETGLVTPGSRDPR
jgi:hypothetical protein